ncbi:PIN domain-containing protein [Aeromonas enteropelogenes]|uniref:PIN domain-containing protein n=1 Tax=Aeromonas enteropelogenes TaxID=29489 RepID=UPI001CBB041D|nr:PIN domain-containing protein [Aeromonas enteropelogenes]UAK70738.1 hypothetical protein K8O95_13710 [Aeromonas enteropelogenes]
MRTNYVLIDFENVQPDKLTVLDKEHFKILVFVGANQSKLSFETVSVIQQLGDKAQYIKIAGVGPNALDFHIAYYIGQLASSDPDGFFHIISKDKGFDPLIQHLKEKKIFATRVSNIFDIPLIKNENAKTPTERVSVVLDKLQQLNASRPRTLNTLNSTISSLFQKKITNEDVSDIVRVMVCEGYISVNGSKVSYSR